MNGSDKLNTYTNFLWILADVMECNLLDLEAEFKKEGFILRHDAKRQMNTAIKSIRRLIGEVNKCNMTTQEYFAEDSDILNALIKIMVDRYGDNHYKALRMYNILEKLKSENTGIPLSDKNIVFSAILNNINDKK